MNTTEKRINIVKLIECAKAYINSDRKINVTDGLRLLKDYKELYQEDIEEFIEYWVNEKTEKKLYDELCKYIFLDLKLAIRLYKKLYWRD